MFLSICCVYAAWVAKGFLLKFRQKGFQRVSRETFDNNIVEEGYTQNMEELWDVAVMKDLWDIFAAQHTILGAHALALCIYVEHKGCSVSLEFKVSACLKTMRRTWYKVQMRKYYPINRTLKILAHIPMNRTWRLTNVGAHSELHTSYPTDKWANTNTHHGINYTGNSNRHHCHKAQL